MVPYIIVDTVADVEKSKNELLHKAIEDSAQKAQVLTTYFSLFKRNKGKAPVVFPVCG